MEEKSNKHDRRLMERSFLGSKDKELQEYLKALPDETANAQWVEIELHDTEMGSDNMDDAGNQADQP